MTYRKPFSVTFIINIKGKSLEEDDESVTTAPMIIDKILNKIIAQLQEYVVRRFLGSYQVSVQTQTEIKAEEIEEEEEISFKGNY